MAIRLKMEDANAPSWLLTMGDMYNLLLVFFIMLFALMSVDKATYEKLEVTLARLGGGPLKEGGVKTAPHPFEAIMKEASGETKVFRMEGLHASVQKLQEGTVYTIGGEEGSFAEGRWELTPKQIEVLVALKKWMVGKRNIVEIRGHTSGNLQDAVALEADGRLRPFAAADLERPDRFEVANHSLLSWLRANEVRKFLVIEHPKLGDAVKLGELQIRIRADSYTRTVQDSANPATRHENRRIEVIALSELMEK